MGEAVLPASSAMGQAVKGIGDDFINQGVVPPEMGIIGDRAGAISSVPTRIDEPIDPKLGIQSGEHLPNNIASTKSRIAEMEKELATHTDKLKADRALMKNYAKAQDDWKA